MENSKPMVLDPWKKINPKELWKDNKKHCWKCGRVIRQGEYCKECFFKRFSS